MADEEFKPLKGDPAHLTTYATKYQQIGDAIARSVTVLNKIAAGDAGKSKAIDALKKKAGDVADDIDKAKDRYQKTAAALLEYSPKLDRAQQDANTAIGQIADKQEALNTAQTTATNAQDDANAAADADKADATSKAKAAQQGVTDASNDLDAAKNAWHAAEQHKNDAAQVALNAIHDVIYGSHAIKDGWWDNWGSKAFEIFKAICKWAAILSVFLSWVPILGEVLLALAAIGAIIDVIDAVVKAVNGDGSWWGVLGAVAMLALTVVGGGLAGRLAKSFKSTAFLKVAPKVGKTLAGRTGLAKIMGEEAVTAVMRGGKRLSQKGLKRMIVKEGENVLTKSNVKSELINVTKTELKETLAPSLKDGALHSVDEFKSEALKTVFKEGLLPDLRHPIKFLQGQAGLGGTYDSLAQGVKLIIKDPQVVLSDPKAVIHLATTGGLAGAYQGYEGYKAIHGHIENIAQGKWGDELAGLSTGGSTIKSIVDNARSMEFKNNG